MVVKNAALLVLAWVAASVAAQLAAHESCDAVGSGPLRHPPRTTQSAVRTDVRGCLRSNARRSRRARACSASRPPATRRWRCRLPTTSRRSTSTRVQLDYARARLAGAPAITGAAERVMGLGRGAMALFGWRRAVVERFLALADAAAQSAYWRTHLDTLGFRLATDTAVVGVGTEGRLRFAVPGHSSRAFRARDARSPCALLRCVSQ